MVQKPTYEELEKRIRELEKIKLVNIDSESVKRIDQRYHLLFKNMFHGAIYCEVIFNESNEPVDYRYLDVNDNFEVITGTKREDILGKRATEFHDKANFDLIKKSSDVAVTGEPLHHTFFLQRTGQYIEEFIFCPEPGFFSTVFHDITDRKVLEDQLSLFKSLVEFSPEAIAISDPDGQLIYINPAHERLFGRSLEEAQNLNYRDYYPPESIEILNKVVAPALKRNESWEGILDTFDAEGRCFPLWERAGTISDSEGNMLYGFGLMHDDSERKQAEKNLQASKKDLQILVDSVNVIPWRFDLKDNRFTFVGRQVEKILGFPVKSWTDLDTWAKRIHPKDRQTAVDYCLSCTQKGEDHDFEYRCLTPAGETVWIRDIVTVRCDERDAPVELIGYMIDITDHNQAEAKIAASLKEKEVLLREIHHRVKNNMQVIVSLLRMHSRRIKDADLVKVFQECRDRVDAMSLIHESLYQSEDLAKIDFKTYLEKLCQNMRQAYGTQRKGIALTVDKCDVSLDMDQGIAIGMVISELVSNAFKHAFPLGKGGSVSINLSNPDERNIELIIEDDGKGMPQQIDIHNPSSLGLQLTVAAVTGELGGSIDIKRDNGTRFVIRFK